MNEENLIEYRVENLEKIVDENKKEIKVIKTELIVLDKNFVTLNLTLQNMLVCFGELKESINGLQAELGTLKAKPSGYWDKVVFALIAAAVSAFVGFIIQGGAA